jgi:hypothetical protein
MSYVELVLGPIRTLYKTCQSCSSRFPSPEHTVNLLLVTSKVDGLDTANLPCSERLHSGGSGWARCSIESRDNRSALNLGSGDLLQ